jgi:hypothetical protein
LTPHGSLIALFVADNASVDARCQFNGDNALSTILNHSSEGCSWWAKHCMTNIIMATAQVSRPGPAGQPDIGYAPDLAKYLARVARRKATEEFTRQLPEGFPYELKSDLVWDGSNIADEYNFVYELNAEELEEIEDALRYFKCKSS